MICGAFIDFELLILNQTNSIACRIFKKESHHTVTVYELTLYDLVLPIWYRICCDVLNLSYLVILKKCKETLSYKKLFPLWPFSCEQSNELCSCIKHDKPWSCGHVKWKCTSCGIVHYARYDFHSTCQGLKRDLVP
jgi:hypothetical protein